MLIFSYLFTGENGKKSYETCLSIIQEQEEEKLENGRFYARDVKVVLRRLQRLV